MRTHHPRSLLLRCWPVWLATLALLLTVPSADGDEALAKGSARAKQGAKHRAKKKAEKRTSRRRAEPRKRRGAGKKMKVKRRRGYAGHGVSTDDLRTGPLTKPSGDLWIYAENFREEIEINIYEADGSLSEAALATLDHTFRCKRTNEERAVDPRLYEMLSRISDHFDGQRIVLTSGFRFQSNEGSRHFHASAMDISIEGVPIRELYEFAESLDAGGMGIGLYPRSDFVHVDFRAPGEPSYRWTDHSRSRRSRGKAPSKSWRGKPKS